MGAALRKKKVEALLRQKEAQIMCKWRRMAAMMTLEA
jgi:hypothetical protein